MGPHRGTQEHRAPATLGVQHEVDRSGEDRRMPDAIVIGAGPNGLVAANLLADEGWDVLVLEEQPMPGGGVRSHELIEPGFVNDHCAAFFPLAAASPVVRGLDLEEHGLRWLRAPLALAHPALDGSCPSIAQDLSATSAALDVAGPGDGRAWEELFGLWQALRPCLVDALFDPFPPLRAGLGLARQLRGPELVRFARFSMLPVRRLGEEHFRSAEARRLLAGLALHTDLLPESALSGFYGWMLGSMAQDIGFPVPEGGAGNLTRALVRRLRAKGGVVRCDAPVRRIAVRKGRAAGVELADGTGIAARRAILADIDAPQLYLRLLPDSAVPASLLRDLERFQWDSATVKVDWTLDGPIPWSAEPARRAGTVHVAESIDELSVTASELARGIVPTNPFLLLGQQSMTDPTRAPEGKETAWAYTHVPSHISMDPRGSITGRWDGADEEQMADRMEARIEALAPGFRDLVRGRHISSPRTIAAHDAAMPHGALGGGTSQLHQQLVFRPTPGLGRPETPVRNLFLASSSAHPGGGVHGACGAIAARAAMTSWHQKIARGWMAWTARRVGSGPVKVP